MKTVRLKKLSLKNFKGVKALSIDFNESVTDIYGDNGTFKTTIFDGFTWCLFGKDHKDRTTFQIKTLDENNNPIPKLEHEVEAILDVNGIEMKLKRVYKEKWVKTRGSAEATMSGHSTNFWFDDVPVTLSEYNAKVKDIVDEQLFKLITNPLYFNSLAWTKRRAILESMATFQTIQEIAAEKQEFAELMDELNGKSFEDFKRIVAAKKKITKGELDEIPTRIDELYKSMPEELDFEGLRKERELKNSKITNLAEQIADLSKVDDKKLEKIKAKQEVKASHMRKMADREEELRNEIAIQVRRFKQSESDLEEKISDGDFDIKRLTTSIENNKKYVHNIDEGLIALRVEFDKKQDEQYTFDESQNICSTCKQPLEIDLTEQAEMKANFNAEKVAVLENLNKEGENLTKEKELLKDKIQKAEEKKNEVEKAVKGWENELYELNKSKTQVVPLNERLKDDEVYNTQLSLAEQVDVDIIALREAKNNTTDTEQISKLKEEQRTLKNETEDINLKLYSEKQIEKGKARIKELEDSAKTLAQELAELERKEFTLQELNTIKLERFEQSINRMFPTVKFKLFNHQLNGGVQEVCETLINGVPYDNANNAATIQAGIEIINVLTTHNECVAPIFVDNAESVILLPQSESQIIRLIVFEDKSHSISATTKANYLAEVEIIESKGGIVLPNKSKY